MTVQRFTHTVDHPATNGKPPLISMDELLAGSAVSVTEEKALTEAIDQGDDLTESLLLGDTHDEQNALCVKHLHPGFARNEALGWLWYNGKRWGGDDAEARLDRAIVDTLLLRIKTAIAKGVDERGKLIHKDVANGCLPNAGKIRGAKYNFSSLVTIPESEFDARPDMLTCQNGVIDLRTGELHPHAPDYLLSHCANAEYDRGTDYSQWVNWLTSTVGKEQADWLQLAVGYSLTGHTKEEILFYLYGPPRSGKGTFTEALLSLLGAPLAKEVEFSTFTADRDGDTQNFDLAPLKPCRVVLASESNSYERFNEAKVKRVTGGNEVYCAFKHHSHFNYRPQYKIWLSSNQPINADPDDDAVWGRLRLVEFPNSYLGKEDTNLKRRMKSPAMLSAVLAWAVAGAMRWYALDGKPLPETPTGSGRKAEQREDLDYVQAWLNEERPFQIDAFVASSKLYDSYLNWCKANGVEPKKAKGLGQSMTRKGYRQDRTRNGRGFTRLPGLDL